MTYRKFDTHTWQDPWFEELSSQAKLLFIYLWTNEVCNQAGLYKISKRRMEFELGFKVDEFIKELSPKVYWYPEEQIVWVRKFLVWQCQNKSFLVGALNSIEGMPEKIVSEFCKFNCDLFKKHDVDTVGAPCLHSVNTNPSSEQNRTEQNRTEKPNGPSGRSAEKKYIAEIQTQNPDKPLRILQKQADEWQKTFRFCDVYAELARLQGWSQEAKNGSLWEPGKPAFMACAGALGKKSEKALQEMRKRDPTFDPEDPDGSKAAAAKYEQTEKLIGGIGNGKQ